MQTAELIHALSRPEAYPFPVDRVEVCQTHLSLVFLAGPLAYKIMKPVVLPFVEFDTLEKRRAVCDNEVRLNRRLAPEVYRGVVPVNQTPAEVRIEADGPVLEWAVKMERLPGEATLERLLLRGELTPELLRTLAGKLAAFHAAAETSERIASYGRIQVVAANIRGNHDAARELIGVALDHDQFERLRTLTEAALSKLGPLIHVRALRGMPCDTHGDLRLEHVYVLPGRAPDGLVIIDCIAFNDLFRYSDPVADVAFLTMDLAYHGRRDLAEVLGAAYLAAAGDQEAGPLLPFYSAYRAAVRGKVEGVKAAATEASENERGRALGRSRGYWRLAEEELRRATGEEGRF